MRIIRALCATAALALAPACQTSAPSAPAAPVSYTAEVDAFLAPLHVVPASAAEFTSHCDAGLALLGRIRATLEARSGPAAIETDFRMFDDLVLLAGALDSDSSLVSETNTNADIRAAAETCTQRVDTFNTQISLSRPVYDRVAAVDLAGADDQTRYMHARTLAAYRRAGVDRDEATRARVLALSNAITETSLAFGRNIRDDASEVTFTSAAALEGLPADYIAAHPPGADGLIHIRMTGAEVNPVVTYATREDTRRRVQIAWRNRAYPANEAVLRDLMRQRHELATTLGYPSFAHLVTEDKMIRTPERAAQFIDQLAAAAGPSAQRDYARELARLQRIDRRTTSVPLWSASYVQQLILKEDYDLDPQEVRQYFSYGNVRDGIIALVQDMFGVEIRPWNTPVWHESVSAHELYDDGQLIGRFYLDMHPREGKFTHAANFPIRQGLAGRAIPVSSLLCNLPDGLMDHGDVETFLHEFGHLLHGLLSGRQRWAQGDYGAIEWDFIEAPSQLLEEWIWDYDTLRRFARNAAGEPIPEALVNRMRAARNFAQGEATLIQLGYASASLNYYNRDPAQVDVDQLYRQHYERYAPYRVPAESHPYASFGHLTDYSAIYYTYQWSQAIAVDLFSAFQREGMRNPAVFARYRAQVLGPGGSAPANTLIETFLGRPTTVDAYAARLRE